MTRNVDELSVAALHGWLLLLEVPVLFCFSICLSLNICFNNLTLQLNLGTFQWSYHIILIKNVPIGTYQKKKKCSYWDSFSLIFTFRVLKLTTIFVQI